MPLGAALKPQGNGLTAPVLKAGQESAVRPLPRDRLETPLEQGQEHGVVKSQTRVWILALAQLFTQCLALDKSLCLFEPPISYLQNGVINSQRDTRTWGTALRGHSLFILFPPGNAGGPYPRATGVAPKSALKPGGTTTSRFSPISSHI